MTFYVFGNLCLFIVWITCIYLNKNASRKAIVTGLLFGCMAVTIAHLYALDDYWHPDYILWPFNIEDFLYGFFIGGITTSAYEVVFNKKRSVSTGLNITWLVIFSLFTVLTFPVAVSVFGLNSIWAHIIPPLFVGLVVVARRKDLRIPSLFSAMVITCITIIIFLTASYIYPSLFETYWDLADLSGYNIKSIPIEELLFAFALGLGGSHFYEFLLNKRLQ